MRRVPRGIAVSGPAGVVVWWDEPADGPTNMAADEWLASEADRRGTLLVRVYAWSPTTVSLGAFQPIAEAGAVADIRGVPLVRRPSGGGAIVHGSDLTYAAAVPKGHAWGASPQAFYDALHGAMATVLADHGVDARPWREVAHAGVDSPRDTHFFCFDRRAPGDLVVDEANVRPGAAGCKIMGSAQRRLAGVVLQHGSLLLRGNPDVAGAARHAGIAEAVPLARIPAPLELARAWVRRVAATLGTRLHEESAAWSGAKAERIAAAAERFREDRWTCRR